MTRFSLFALPSLLAPFRVDAQPQSGLDGAIRVGPGVTFPRLLHKEEPEYSPDARADHIQGNVVLELAVDEVGRPTGVRLVSPLGYGLDERAQAAVEKWVFAPGMKGGKPVKILATVEVSFRFPGLWFDEKVERQRTSFNVAIQALKRTNASAQDVSRAVKSIEDLSRHGFPLRCTRPACGRQLGTMLQKT
jgi:TonB family protein